jgi:hypothetical protein
LVRRARGVLDHRNPSGARYRQQTSGTVHLATRSGCAAKPMAHEWHDRSAATKSSEAAVDYPHPSAHRQRGSTEGQAHATNHIRLD